MVLNWLSLKNFDQVPFKTPFKWFLKILSNLKTFENFASDPLKSNFHCIYKKEFFIECVVSWVKKADFVLLLPQGIGSPQISLILIIEAFNLKQINLSLQIKS